MRSMILLAVSAAAPMLFACGFAYLFALLVIHLLAPRLDPARIETAGA